MKSVNNLQVRSGRELEPGLGTARVPAPDWLCGPGACLEGLAPWPVAHPVCVLLPLQAIIHPDTNQKIFMPFRMSGYIPFGTPILGTELGCFNQRQSVGRCVGGPAALQAFKEARGLCCTGKTRASVVGLLLPNQTLTSTVIWQVLPGSWTGAEQPRASAGTGFRQPRSHNACVNYANRNATKPSSTSKFVQGYLGAVLSAVSIAVGLNVLIQRANQFSPATRLLLQRFVPFPAVAGANICNVILMRHSELEEGIHVLDSNGEVVGSSRIAAKHVCGCRFRLSPQVL
uniref:Uncharacterized protein n=1 Tax=Sphaerodactylus townsendi TaxID=933632 RepID=A0ACB8E9J4_9SAUR